MKKSLLIGTSALASVALFSGAALAAGPELSISGASDFGYQIDDADGSSAGVDGPDGDDINIGNSSTQLIFDATATADNGLEYGARIDWRTGSNTIDEHYVFFGGSFGTLHFGGDDGVIDNNVPGGESVTAGDFLWDGNNQPGTSADAGSAGLFPTLSSGTDDANKFSYYSPNFAGFSVGASYIPNSAEGSGAGANITGGVTNGGNGSGAQVEGTLRYDGSFGAGDFSVGVGYAHGEGGDTNQDREGLMAGATASFAGFSVGVGYGDNNETGIASGTTGDAGGWWNVAASYGFGAATVYGGYMESEATPAGTTQADEAEQMGFGVGYTVAEGLTAYAEYSNVESTDASANTTADTDSLVLGTTISY